MKKGRQDNILEITEELQQQKGEGRIFFQHREVKGQNSEGKIYVLKQNLSVSDVYYAAHQRNDRSVVTWY